jgi:hypothetical protein
MLLKRRTPRIEDGPGEVSQGFAHLDPGAIAVLRWLRSNRVEFVLVGPVACAIRGRSREPGPAAIVPAPYRRNLERLARALDRAGALRRQDGTAIDGGADTRPARLTGESFAAGRSWTLRCGAYDLDVEGQTPASGGYQELLYEATSFELGSGLRVEVASPEDIEHYTQLRRTGTPPEIRITRNAAA